MMSEEEKQEALNELEQTRVKEIFDKLDDDHDGFVTMPAIEAALIEAGVDTSGELGKRALAHCTPDGRGLVSWPAFAKAVVVLGVKIRIGMFLRDQFEKMDKEKTGCVTHANLIELVHGSPAAEWMTDEMVGNLYKRLDPNNAGKVEFKVFLIGFFEVMKEKFAEMQAKK